MVGVDDRLGRARAGNRDRRIAAGRRRQVQITGRLAAPSQGELLGSGRQADRRAGVGSIGFDDGRTRRARSGARMEDVIAWAVVNRVCGRGDVKYWSCKGTTRKQQHECGEDTRELAARFRCRTPRCEPAHSKPSLKIRSSWIRPMPKRVSPPVNAVL